LEKNITSHILGVIINGQTAPRVGGALNLCFEGIERDSLVAALDLEGYSVSSGSACASGVVEPTHVLLAMGRSVGLAQAGLRVSIPYGTTWAQLEGFATALEKVVARRRKIS
jgi:cysteine desulfurase